jgi:hypothetical protein
MAREFLFFEGGVHNGFLDEKPIVEAINGMVVPNMPKLTHILLIRKKKDMFLIFILTIAEIKMILSDLCRQDVQDRTMEQY